MQKRIAETKKAFQKGKQVASKVRGLEAKVEGYVETTIDEIDVTKLTSFEDYDAVDVGTRMAAFQQHYSVTRPGAVEKELPDNANALLLDRLPPPAKTTVGKKFQAKEI